MEERKGQPMEEELKYWLDIYPELDEEEILDILEAVDMDTKVESSTNFSDFDKPQQPSGIKGVLKKIIDPDD